MKKTKLLGISLLLVFLIIILTNIVYAGEPRFVCIEDNGDQISVLATGYFTVFEMGEDALGWHYMGVSKVKYYKDRRMHESDLIATYDTFYCEYAEEVIFGQTYTNWSNIPSRDEPAFPKSTHSEPETPCFEAIFSIAGLLALSYLVRRKK